MSVAMVMVLSEIDEVSRSNTKNERVQISYGQLFSTTGNEKADELAKLGADSGGGHFADIMSQNSTVVGEEVCCAITLTAGFSAWKERCGTEH